MKNEEFLSQLRKKIPFLQGIPDKIYFKLNHSELHIPDDKCSTTLIKLQKQIGHYVISYKANTFNKSAPVEKHLCAHLKSAKLNEEQLKILKFTEKEYLPKDVSFAVYQKPLTIININESKIWKLSKAKL